MKSYVDDIVVTDPNGEKAILYPNTKQEAVEGLLERLANVEKPDITETTSPTMPNSNAGRLLIEEIGGGESQQGENPSPDNPQEIKKSVISEIRTHGKNFITNKITSGTKNGITYTKNSDGSITLNGTASETTEIDVSNFVVDRESAYILSGCPSGGYYNTYSIRYYMWSKEWKQLVRNDDIGSGVLLKHDDGAAHTAARITIESGVTVSNLTFYPMIREVGTDATYEPYTESVIALSQPIELYGMGDVQDVIEGGKVRRRFVENVLPKNGWQLDRIEPVHSFIEVKCVFPNTEYVDSPNNYLLCTHVGNGTYNRLVLAYGALYMRLPMSETIKTFEDVTEFLANNDVKYLIEYKTPTTEELPLADQIALNSLATYDGITYLEFDSEIEPTFKGEYGTSKVGGYTLKGMLAGRNGELYGKDYNSRLSALEATVVNNI